MTAHSPGPWRAYPAALGDLHEFVVADSRGVCRVNFIHVQDDVALANSRLIVAAPDLLAACESLRLRGCKCANMRPRACPQCEAIETAIAKART